MLTRGGGVRGYNGIQPGTEYEGRISKRCIRINRRNYRGCNDLNDTVSEGLIEDQREVFRPLQHLLREGDGIHVVADIRVASVRENDVERHCLHPLKVLLHHFVRGSITVLIGNHWQALHALDPVAVFFVIHSSLPVDTDE